MGAIICTFSDPADYIISDGKKKWIFDWSDRFGPSLSNGKGQILDNPYPGERSPFWRCVTLWKRQGKRWKESERRGIREAIWDEPPAGRYVVDPRGVIVDTDEPAFFDEQYSRRVYVDHQGNPYSFPKLRRRQAQLKIMIGPRS